jgi:hypothetical protein
VKALVGAAALAVIVSGASAGPVAADSETVLDQARRAAQASSFNGVVEIVWRDGTVIRRQQLSVHAAGGVLSFGGLNPIMALDQARIVRKKGAWDVLWPAAFGRLRRPDSGEKYEQRVSVGPTMLGYDTFVIDIRRGDRVREHLYVERSRGLLLRREQFDDQGRIQRSVGFQELTILTGTPALARPVSIPTKALQSVSGGELRAPYSAPAVLGDGYQRTGVFRQGGVVQVVYSDGIYDLSVFEQRGRLASKAAPPGGSPVRIGAAKGWHYTWPGGQMILWQGGRMVYTVVADAPYDDVAGAIRTVKGSSSGLSLASRFRRTCRSLVGAFRDDR